MSETNPASRLIKRLTNRSFVDVCASIEVACQRHQFGVIATIDLRAKMIAKDVEFDRDCVVFEVCNPHKAKGVLSINMDIASALPCTPRANRR